MYISFALNLIANANKRKRLVEYRPNIVRGEKKHYSGRGLALDTIWCTPFWRLCDDFKLPKKKITRMYVTNIFQVDLCWIFRQYFMHLNIHFDSAFHSYIDILSVDINCDKYIGFDSLKT